MNPQLPQELPKEFKELPKELGKIKYDSKHKT